jgi:prolipoprotein diacylglyceryl transferase
VLDLLLTPVAAIHWNANPELFRIGSFAVHWYGLLFALGFYAGYLILTRIFRKEGASQDDLDRLTLYMVVGTVVGARFGHILFYDPGYYFSQPAEILKIWEGGLASHGAALGILLAILIYARNTAGQSFLWVIDRISLVVALAGAFIRTGNLMNSEIVGKPAEVPWAFVFERLPEAATPRHPVQIYEALAYLAIFGVLLWLYRRYDGKFAGGLLFGWFLVLVFAVRFLLEYFKAAQAAFREDLMMNMGQLLSLPFVLVGAALLVWIQVQSSGTAKAGSKG